MTSKLCIRIFKKYNNDYIKYIFRTIIILIGNTDVNNSKLLREKIKCSTLMGM